MKSHVPLLFITVAILVSACSSPARMPASQETLNSNNLEVIIYEEPKETITSTSTIPISQAAPPVIPGGESYQEANRVRVESVFKAYGNRISKLDFRGDQGTGDWVFTLDGEPYWFAGGKFLPEAELGNTDKWSTHSWYQYPKDLKEPPVYSEEEKQRYENAVKTMETRPPRNNSFWDTIWSSFDEASTWEQMKSINFLGKRTTVHLEILDELSRVERSILRHARTDRTVQGFIDELREVGGYNWRNVAGTSNRSMHSYGLAVDLVPRSWKGKWVYWRWAETDTPWYEVPLRDRFPIPRKIIEAFEAEGFIWGGKWLFFDDMHFEYRPDVLLAIQW